MNNKNITDVENFWNTNPLFTGESENRPGSSDYFIEHTSVYVNDCFAGRFDFNTIPSYLCGKKVLDLGCGPGFWIEQLAKSFPKEIVAADLTDQALNLAKQRVEMLNIRNCTFAKANAEDLPFDDSEFEHINCQGVVHHTPDTGKALKEISRVLCEKGTFSISVYYKNIFLRTWPVIRFTGKVLAKLGAGLKGRGRETIFELDDVDEIVKYYDGSDNPIGKAYARDDILKLLPEDLIVDKVFLHFFPARSLPVKIPNIFHRYLDKSFGFMIYITGTKSGLRR